MTAPEGAPPVVARAPGASGVHRAVLWIDASAGASGDMLLGALVDLGVPVEVLQQAVDAVLPAIALRVSPTSRHGIAATKVDVSVETFSGRHEQPAPPGSGTGRPWREVRRLLTGAALDEGIRRPAIGCFERLARAEAAAHGVLADEVHFHEVGGLDAIADVVGTCAGLAWLAADEVVVSPVALGTGSTRGLHGHIPVPGPAVLAVLSEVGAPVQAGAAPHEACTPTGAALLAQWATGWGTLPAMVVRGTGCGAGGRDLPEVANLLRLVAGVAAAPDAGPSNGSNEPLESSPGTASSPDTAVSLDDEGLPAATEQLLLECNVDDLDPRLWPQVLADLFDAGAADAWLTPILMKKGRPAHTLSVLIDPAVAETARRIVLARTSAIGLREHTVAKRALPRHDQVVEVLGQQIRVKVAHLGAEVVNAQPEFADLAAAAQATGRSEKAVLALAIAAAAALVRTESGTA